MRVAVLLLFILIAGGARADEWQPADRAMLGAALGLLVVDWGQTRYIAKNRAGVAGSGCASNGPTANASAAPCAPPEGQRTHYETNPFLGSEPSVKTVDRYFPAAMLGVTALSLVLPSEYRKLFLSGVITIEALVVMRNHQLGVQIRF